MPTIFILNGPNLNLLGEREPEIYGSTTLDEIRQWCEADARELGLEIDFRQSNFEGEIIEAILAARKQAAGIIINPAGYTFTSIAILDALKCSTVRRSNFTCRTCTSARTSTIIACLPDRDRRDGRLRAPATAWRFAPWRR